MKLSLKLSSLAMAACASLYALSILIWQIPAVHSWTIWRSYIGYLPHVAVLIGMIIFGIGLYLHQEQIPRLTKSLRWQAIGITIITICAVLYTYFTDGIVSISGIAYCYWESWPHILILLWVAAWLLQLGWTKHEHTHSSPALGIVGIVVSLAAALLLIFMVVSYVRVLMLGHVAGFHTTAWLSWLRPSALIVLGGTMLLGDRGFIKEKEQTDNGIQEAQSYSKANQIIAKVSIGTLVVFTILTLLSGIFGWFENTYWEECYFITVLGSIHMLWISSVIAMLLEKVLPRWHRTLNILAPIVVNGVLVLLALNAILQIDYRIPNFVEDFLCLCLLMSIVFVIIVWLINTIIVLRTIARTKEKK
ncbi:MAG: hypothetical protein UH084_07585 [Paludibacteraceae bacterium]|nr:hypothetical protein [Paludibacteraceae bacterium]